MSNESLPHVDRRTVLRLGGMSVALGAVLAACGAGENGGTTGVGPEGIPQIGVAPPLQEEGSTDISDARLLRTATSMHYNGMDAIDRVLALNFVSYDVASAARGYRGLLQQQADALAEATTAVGGKPYEQKNAAIDKNIVTKALDLINVSATKADDATRFLHAFATLAAETHQSFVPLLTTPELRGAAMQIGAVHHRVSALLARLISPENVVNTEGITIAAPTTETTVAAEGAASAGPAPVAVYQIPGAFGPLGAVQIVLGKLGVDDEFKRTQLNIETPSLNSLVADEA